MSEEFVQQSDQASGDTSQQAPEPTFEVKVRGEMRQVPLSQLRENYSKGEDYTQKTTALAEERKQWQSQLTSAQQEKQQYLSALQEVASVMQDESKLGQYIKQQFGADLVRAAKQQAADEGELTQDRVKQLVAEQIAAIKQEFQGSISQVEQQRQLDGMTQQYAGVITNKLGELFNQYPLIKNLPNAEALVRQQVAAMKPQNLGQALGAFQQVMGQFNESLLNIQKQQQAGPSPALLKGIEPPGGLTPGPTPNPAFKNVKDPKLHDLVMQDVARMLGQG